MLYLCICLGGVIATLLFVIRNLYMECNKLDYEKEELQADLSQARLDAGELLKQLVKVTDTSRDQR